MGDRLNGGRKVKAGARYEGISPSPILGGGSLRNLPIKSLKNISNIPLPAKLTRTNGRPPQTKVMEIPKPNE